MFTACRSCRIMQEALDYERDRNKELTETLTSLLKPQVIVANSESESLKPVTPSFQRWSRRKAELERLDRESAAVRANSPVIAKPNSDSNAEAVRELEQELGVE